MTYKKLFERLLLWQYGHFCRYTLQGDEALETSQESSKGIIWGIGNLIHSEILRKPILLCLMRKRDFDLQWFGTNITKKRSFKPGDKFISVNKHKLKMGKLELRMLFLFWHNFSLFSLQHQWALISILIDFKVSETF